MRALKHTSAKIQTSSSAAGQLTIAERFIERSEIRVDVAACIRWFLFGLAALATAVSGLVIACEGASKSKQVVNQGTEIRSVDHRATQTDGR